MPGNKIFNVAQRELVDNIEPRYYNTFQPFKVNNMNEPSLKSKNVLPLVMLHGLLGLPDNWDEIMPFLPKTCQKGNSG